MLLKGAPYCGTPGRWLLLPPGKVFELEYMAGGGSKVALKAVF